MAAWLVWTGILIALLGLFVLYQYNRMVTLRNRCTESWANVDAELRRRHDLVPNLVAAVQGAAGHERAVLAAVTEARARAMAVGQDRRSLEGAENGLARAMGRLLALAEAYPSLKASRNFLQLQEELSLTEDRIQAARRFYNGNVRDYRDQTRQFPGVLVARAFRFGDVPFFEVESPAMRRAPTVAVGA
ncbi:MAG TPA: LemA family protein [Candidatus Thermoplasmatota archaeon]|nr:LemA family protein [Candidatus Thermoplasmatota archaeon]